MRSYYLNLLLVLISLTTLYSSSAQETIKSHDIPKYVPSDKILYNTIVNLDAAYFDAYNNCDMKTQGQFYDENLEFFLDQGGLNTSKKSVLESIEKNICGKVTRILVEGSIEVYPIANYGAVEIGYHRFFNNEEPNSRSTPSKFVIIWKEEESGWKITKVISLH